MLSPSLNGKNKKRFVCLIAILLFFAIPALKVAILTPAVQPVTLPPLPAGKNLYVTVYGYHSAIIVEQPTGWALGPPGNENASYLEYGWGDRRFYGTNDQSVGAMLAVAFWGTSSVVYVGAPTNIVLSGRAVYHRKISGSELTRLFTTLEQAMLRTTDGKRLLPLPIRTGVNGRFFPAREYYIFWSDCNRWTVERLHEIGLAKSGIGVIFNGQVEGRLQGFTFSKRR